MGNWFDVDKEGFKEMFANFPPERMVAELVQNSFDTDAKMCKVVLADSPSTRSTVLLVEDDNPDGFKDLRDAYTLFKSTDKRGDPTKRGKFNLGEKIVLARAKSGIISTTKGTVVFDKTGRKATRKKRDMGSVVSIDFPRWTEAERKEVLSFLRRIYVPKGIDFRANDEELKYAAPMKSVKTKLATEFLKTDAHGNQVMTKTQRMTNVWFYPKRHESAYLYELGLPVCAIDGRFDANVQQKVPLSHDRTLVPQSFLQDIYAEMVVALDELLEPGDLGDAHVHMALEDERVDAETAASLFKRQFGENAVIQTLDADANQEAARQGATIVSARTFGSSINSKFRGGGVKTTTESYSRDKEVLSSGNLMPDGYKEVKVSEHRKPLADYVHMLCNQFYGKDINVNFAQWMGTNTAAIYSHGTGITFNIMRVTRDMMKNPVSKCSSLVLHELAHSCGVGHNGVYDHEFEELVNKHTQLLVQHQELYKEFEPEFFDN